MNYTGLPYHIFPLGDSAVTIDYGSTINEEINDMALARFHQFQLQRIPGVIEIVPSYSSLTIYYDVFELKKNISFDLTAYEWIKLKIEELMKHPVLKNETEKRSFRIPVCYQEEFAPDLQQMATTKNCSVEEIIRIHTSVQYRVYMIGFLPGFAYMGVVDDKIVMPRKQQPVNVKEGSVGIAGKQTGIYPLSSPGGWQIIGRTPVKMFDAEKDVPAFLKAGDIVQFYSITKDEFESY